GDGGRKRLRPAPDDEGEQRELEHERLEVTRALRGDHGDEHGGGDEHERRTWHVRPDAERRDRDRWQGVVGRRPAVAGGRERRDGEREERNETNELVRPGGRVT